MDDCIVTQTEKLQENLIDLTCKSRGCAIESGVSEVLILLNRDLGEFNSDAKAGVTVGHIRI